MSGVPDPYYAGLPVGGEHAPQQAYEAYAYDTAGGFADSPSPYLPVGPPLPDGTAGVAAVDALAPLPPESAPPPVEEIQGQHVASARRAGAPLVLIPLCRKGDRAGIERQVQAGASVHEVDCEGNTPLHVAVEAPKNETATVQCLLEHGANVNATNYLGAAPLHYVCLRKSNHRGIANILLENGALIDSQTLAGKTPLHFACEQQLPELVEVLCSSGANTNITDVEGNIPLHSCLGKPGGRDMVKRQIAEHLMACRAFFQVPNLQGFMPLHMACSGGYIRCVQLLLERQADPASLSARGETGLHLACTGGFSEVAQMMIQMAPQTIDRQDADGNTPLHMCAVTGNADCAVLLLRMGAEANSRNRAGRTALELAQTRGTDLSSTHSPELVQMLRDTQRTGNCQPM